MRTPPKTLIRVRTWLTSVLLCAGAMFLGYELGSETARLLGGEPGIWARVGKGFVWGGVIAALQWPIVRVVGVPPVKFLVASAVCFAVGYPFGQTVQGMLVLDWGLNWIWGYGGALATFGLFLGTSQWWVFRRHIPRASLWLLLSVLGWILTGAAWINFGVNSGEDAIAYGIATGLALAWLVHSRPLPPLADSSSHTPGARVPSRDALIAFGLGAAITASSVALFGRHLISFTVDKTVDPASYDDYVGRYDYGNDGVMAVTREGGQLFTKLTGQRWAEIFPHAKDEFFWKVVDARIAFVRDDQGRVSGGIHRQDGKALNVPKIDISEFIVDTTVDPAVYHDYVGRYDYGNEGVMMVTTESGRLFAQLTRQRRFEVFPHAKDEFFWRVVDARITFVRDDQGRVNGGIHYQDGQTTNVPKLK